jgi:1-phosphofructokinase
MCEFFSAAGVRVAVDASGPALLAAVAARPALIKPNRDELAEAVGHPVDSIGDAIEAAHELRDRGAQSVLASLGADGAVLVDDDGVTIGEAPIAEPRSTVGAGDSLLAGFLAAGARGRSALAEGLAWGAAAVSLPASRMPRPQDIRRDIVRINAQPDLGRSLIA